MPTPPAWAQSWPTPCGRRTWTIRCGRSSSPARAGASAPGRHLGRRSSFDTKAGGAGYPQFRRWGQRLCDRDGAGFIHAMFNSRKPIIAAFNGPAVGVGSPWPCPPTSRSPRQAPNSASCSTPGPSPRRRPAPGSCRSWSACPAALRWCLEGRMIGPDEALKAGLISEIIEPRPAVPRPARSPRSPMLTPRFRSPSLASCSGASPPRMGPSTS